MKPLQNVPGIDWFRAQVNLHVDNQVLHSTTTKIIFQIYLFKYFKHLGSLKSFKEK